MLKDIDHIVVLMLENRSYDHVFGDMPQPDNSEPRPQDHGAWPPVERPLGTDGPAFSGRRIDDIDVRVHPDPGHEADHVKKQIQLGGYTRDYASHFPGNPYSDAADALTRVLDYHAWSPAAAPPTLPATHALARHGVVFTRWHSSVAGPTWPNRHIALSGTARGVSTMPERLWDYVVTNGPAERKNTWYANDQTTLIGAIDAARRKDPAKGPTWRIYHAGGWSTSHVSLMHDIAACRADPAPGCWADGIARFERDCQPDPKDHTKHELGSFSWIEPDHFCGDQNSAHPPSTMRSAEHLLARVFNALRKSAAWDRSLLIVTYDEHGGFYDRIAALPAVKGSPADHPADGRPQWTAPDPELGGSMNAFARLGVRVPALMVGPSIEPGLCNDIVEHAAIVRTVCERWSIPALTRRDEAATSLAAAIAAIRGADSKSMGLESIHVPEAAWSHAGKTGAGRSDYQSMLAQTLEEPVRQAVERTVRDATVGKPNAGKTKSPFGDVEEVSDLKDNEDAAAEAAYAAVCAAAQALDAHTRRGIGLALCPNDHPKDKFENTSTQTVALHRLRDALLPYVAGTIVDAAALDKALKRRLRELKP